MKRRLVLMSIEIDTDIPLSRLRKTQFWNENLRCASAVNGQGTLWAHQAQANVVQPEKPKAAVKRGERRAVS